MEKDVGLFLDDIRTPAEVPPQIKDWVVVRTYEEYMKFIEGYTYLFEALPPIISLDHDLSVRAMEFHLANKKGTMIDYEAIGDKTGMQCLEDTIELCRKENIKMKDKVVIHSANPVGSRLMQDLCNNFKKYQGLPEDCFLHKWKVTDDYVEMENYKGFLNLKRKYI